MREYKRKRGSRSYLTGYTEEQMEGALSVVREGLSFAKAAIDFKQINVIATNLLNRLLPFSRSLLA